MNRLSRRLSRSHAARRNGESGLALLDVLLGMAIFALIAVIAVQANGLMRQRGYMSQAAASAKDVSLILSARINDDALPVQGTTGTPSRTFPDWDGAAAVASPTNLSGIDANLTPGIEIARYGTTGTPASGFFLCAVHRTTTDGPIDAFAGYHSSSGAIIQSGTGTPPAAGGNPCNGAT